MLPKNTLKKLEDFLKKQEMFWLREEQPEDGVMVTSKPSPSGGTLMRACRIAKPPPPFETFLMNQEQFKRILLKAIKDFGEKNKKVYEYVEIYKKACITKAVFSKVFHHSQPSKDTVILFALGFEYTLQEAEELLKHAGYFLGDCIKRDMIFKYCFENEIFNIRDVNKLLEQENEKILRGPLFLRK